MAKAIPELDKLFQREIDAILESAGDGEADFTRFVFFSCNYSSRTFRAYCNFSRATFAQNALFTLSRFKKGASFDDATFSLGASFAFTEFAHDAVFGGATFTKLADFGYTKFSRVADFSAVMFLDSVRFNRTEFLQDSEYLPGPIFTYARFSKPELSIFYKSDLSHAFFHRCDVTNINFSSVTWAERKGCRKRMVFEELVKFGDDDLVKIGHKMRLSTYDLETDELSPDDRDYGLIAELYQQLKKNYDERKDYWTAGDFHYGEMEMKRLATPRGRRLLAWLEGSRDRLAKRLNNGAKSPKWPAFWRFYSVVRKLNIIRRWWHQHLSLIAWYKYASEYGENYRRPVMWLVVVLALFACLFPLKGVRYDPAKDLDAGKSASPQVLTYRQPAPAEKTWLIGWRAETELLKDSCLSSLEVASFQKERMYEPVYRTGHFLILMEMVMSSSLFALFLLAIRRQFRR